MFYTERGFKIIIVVTQSHGMAIISKSVFISVNDFERRLLLWVCVIIVTYYYNTLFVANKNAITTIKTFYARTYSHRRRRISLYCSRTKARILLFYFQSRTRAIKIEKN